MVIPGHDCQSAVFDLFSCERIARSKTLDSLNGLRSYELCSVELLCGNQSCCTSCVCGKGPMNAMIPCGQ